MMLCDECEIWRLVNSRRKLKQNEKKELEKALDGMSFSCGAQLQQDYDIPEYLKDVFLLESHFHAVCMVISAFKECMDVGSKLSKEYEEKRAQNRKCLLAIISTIRFLARQGLALRGVHIDDNGEAHSNFMQLLLKYT